MDSLQKKLTDYAQNGRIPMHMPGHKRTSRFFFEENPYQIDITEIEGFDDYHAPEELLLNSMNHAAQIYGTKRSWYLVNGSTSGILTAISAATNRGDTIICARNCHKSVYHAIELRDLNPVYIYPDLIENLWINGCISKETVEKAVKEHPESKAVLLTSPTYEGIVSDIRGIADIVHAAGMLLIVDEAHGAHFPFSDKFPASAIHCGADIVIQSLHKTLPCYTQTAILHVCSDRPDVDKIQKYLGIYQTSSPSYVFMAAMEQCISYMAGDGRTALESYWNHLTRLRDELSRIPKIHLLAGNFQMSGYDPSKLVIFCEGLTGNEQARILREEFNIEPEMTADNYVLLMTSLCDRPEWYPQIIAAVKSMADRVPGGSTPANTRPPRTESVVCMKPSKAFEADKTAIPLSQSCNKISGECVYVYPPGIPILMPGEQITEEILAVLLRHKECGLKLKGMKDKNGEVIQCIK